MKPWFLLLSAGWWMPSVCTSGTPPVCAGDDVRYARHVIPHEHTCERCFSLSSSPSIPDLRCRRSRSSACYCLMSHCTSHTRLPKLERWDNAYLGLFFTLKSSLGVLRLFLGLSNSLKPSRKGFALALSEVYRGLLLINLDGPGL